MFIYFPFLYWFDEAIFRETNLLSASIVFSVCFQTLLVEYFCHVEIMYFYVVICQFFMVSGVCVIPNCV